MTAPRWAIDLGGDRPTLRAPDSPHMTHHRFVAQVAGPTLAVALDTIRRQVPTLWGVHWKDLP